jgi:hypothetical protein
MKLEEWYAILLIVWAVVAVLAFGFSGGHIFFDLSGSSWIDQATTVAGWMLLRSPLLLAPFGIKLRGKGPRP